MQLFKRIHSYILNTPIPKVGIKYCMSTFSPTLIGKI